MIRKNVSPGSHFASIMNPTEICCQNGNDLTLELVWLKCRLLNGNLYNSAFQVKVWVYGKRGTL